MLRRLPVIRHPRPIDLLLLRISRAALVLAFACARQAQLAPAMPSASPPEAPGATRTAPAPRLERLPSDALADVDAEQEPVDQANDATLESVVSATGPSPSQAPASVVPVTGPRSRQVMLDIEASLTIEVRDVAAAVARVRSLVAASNGQLIEESLQDSRRERPTAHLTVRIPSSGALDFLAQVESASVVRSRRLNSRDVGKEYFDAQLRVQSLQRVLDRYRELLHRATSIDEALKIEEQITRVCAEIERINGELSWLKDRVARATVHLEIFAKGDWVEPVVTPEAKLYPGFRAAGSIDWRGDRATQYGMGAGLSLRFSRHFSIDFDGFQNTDAPHGGLEMTLLTLGGEFYSDFLGAGRRKWLNPYLGLRGGYARIEGTNQILVGGTVGVELYKSDAVTLQFDSRFLEAFGGRLGNHLVIVPALGANFAF